MSRFFLRALKIYALFAVLIASQNGCSGGSTGAGNPIVQVNVQVGGYSSASVSNLVICPEAITLYPTNTSASPVSVEIMPKDLTLSGSAVPLATGSIPIQSYSSAQLTLGSSCASQQSLQVTNTNGSYSTQNSMKAQFQGSVSFSSSSGVLQLSIQPIVNQLAGISANSQIVTTLANTSGQMSLSTNPTFIQLQTGTITANGTTVQSQPFANPVISGDTLICTTFYDSGGVRNGQSVTDSAGNSYLEYTWSASSGTLSQWILETWISAGVTGGSNLVVTASFSSAFSGQKNIICHDYAGIASGSSNAGDAVASDNGTSANASVGSGGQVSQAGDLIYAAAAFASTGAAAGSGFTQRASYNGVITEDQLVTSTGQYTATFANPAMSWILTWGSFKQNL